MRFTDAEALNIYKIDEIRYDSPNFWKLEGIYFCIIKQNC
jgi:hypothetical protein